MKISTKTFAAGVVAGTAVLAVISTVAFAAQSNASKRSEARTAAAVFMAGAAMANYAPYGRITDVKYTYAESATPGSEKTVLKTFVTADVCSLVSADGLCATGDRKTTVTMAVNGTPGKSEGIVIRPGVLFPLDDFKTAAGLPATRANLAKQMMKNSTES